MTIWFDMDGTIANLYGVDNWLPQLQNESPTPYQIAKPLVNMNILARYLNALTKKGYEIGIISWGSKFSSDNYLHAVAAAKQKWLRQHLRSVKFSKIHITHYGTNKFETCGEGILFDDEAPNRNTWQGQAFEPKDIFNVLKQLKDR